MAKREKNYLQNIHITPLTTVGELRCFGMVGSSSSTNGTRYKIVFNCFRQMSGFHRTSIISITKTKIY